MVPESNYIVNGVEEEGPDMDILMNQSEQDARTSGGESFMPRSFM